MKSNRKVYFFAMFVVLIGIGLLIYSLFVQPSGGLQEGFHRHFNRAGQPQPPNGTGFRPDGPRERGPYEGLFRNIGTLTIIFGCISFSWFYLKRKMKTSSKLTKKIGKIVYNVHTYTGWAALLLTVAHGTYFILKQFNNPDVFTGLAAFVVLLGLIVYGLFLTKKRSSKDRRKVHVWMSYAWMVMLVIHAGAHFLLPAAITLAVWGVIWYLEGRTSQNRKTADNLS